MHNSVVFYRKPHNFSFYPIIHKKVLIFAKRSPPQGGRPFCIVWVSLLYDAFLTARKDALHRNVPVKYDEIRVVILNRRCRSGIFQQSFIWNAQCFDDASNSILNSSCIFSNSLMVSAIAFATYFPMQSLPKNTLQVSPSLTNSFKGVISLRRRMQIPARPFYRWKYIAQSHVFFIKDCEKT